MVRKPGCLGFTRLPDRTGELAITSISSNEGAGRRQCSQHAIRLKPEPLVGRRGIFSGGFGTDFVVTRSCLHIMSRSKFRLKLDHLRRRRRAAHRHVDAFRSQVNHRVHHGCGQVRADRSGMVFSGQNVNVNDVGCTMRGRATGEKCSGQNEDACEHDGLLCGLASQGSR